MHVVNTSPRAKAPPKADWLTEGGTVWQRPEEIPSSILKKMFASCTKKKETIPIYR